MYKTIVMLAVVCRVSLVGIALLSSVLRVVAQTAPPSPPLELPAVIVEETRDQLPQESWRYASIEGAEILSNASDRETQKLVREFEIFRRALAVVWPAVQPASGSPVAIILCGKGGRFKELLPAEGRHSGKANTWLASSLLQGRGRAAIVLDLETTTTSIVTHEAMLQAAGNVPVGSAPLSEGSSAFAFTINHEKQLYREYVRCLLGGGEQPAPAWFEEGVAQLFMGMRIEKDRIVFAKVNESTIEDRISPSANMISARGQPEFVAQLKEFKEAMDRNRGQIDQDFNSALYYRHLMPWPEFFAVRRDSPDALSPIAGRWAKQAQALVHMCMYGNKQKYRKGFVALLARSGREPINEALMQECLGLNYAKLTDAIYSYIQTTAYKFYTFKLVEGSLPKIDVIGLREASDAEVGRIKGTALSLGQNHEAARRVLMAPYVRGAREPELLGALGLAVRAAGDDAGAEKFLELAIARKSNDPRVYLELARLRFAQAAQAAKAEAPFSASAVAGILTPLFSARSHPPKLAEVYHLIADAWNRAPVAPTRDNLAVLIEGVGLFPKDSALILGTATLHSLHGFKAEAAELKKIGLATATDEATKAQFRSLQ